MKEHIMAVQRMQDYIKDNYMNKISLVDLSKISCYSSWHSHRIFKEYVGITPADYIRKLRLSNTALKLKYNKVKITDIAFELGYESVEGYSRAYYKEFGMTPIEYAKNPVPINLFIPYKVVYRNKEKVDMSNVKNVFIQVVHKPERKVVIKRGIKAKEYFQYCEEVGCDVWGLLTSMDSITGEPVCMWLPDKYINPNTSVYVQGVEESFDYNDVIPEGFDIITLPEAEYLMFQGEPFDENDYEEAIINIQDAIKKYDPSIIGYKWDEENPRIQLEPRGERGYIELKAVKKK